MTTTETSCVDVLAMRRQMALRNVALRLLDAAALVDRFDPECDLQLHELLAGASWLASRAQRNLGMPSLFDGAA